MFIEKKLTKLFYGIKGLKVAKAMDLLSKGGSGSSGRVLAARHITAEQAVPAANNAINTTLICHSMDIQPDFETYLAGIIIVVNGNIYLHSPACSACLINFENFYS